MKKGFCFIICTSILFFHAISFGNSNISQWNVLPPIEQWYKIEPNENHFKINEITLGDSTLQSIQGELGNSSIIYTTEGGPNYICYKAADNNDETLLLLETDAAGIWEFITAFTVMKSNVSLRDKCSKSLIVNSNIKTLSGIKLGVSREYIINLLGKPTSKALDGLYYGYSLEKADTYIQDNKSIPYKYDLNIIMIFKFKDNSLTEFKIRKVETS